MNTYSEDDTLTTTTYLDENRQPVDTALGYASVEKEYDYAGHKIRESYFDAQSAPTTNLDGYGQALYTWDEDGHQTSRSEECRVGKECRSRWSPDH